MPTVYPFVLSTFVLYCLLCVFISHPLLHPLPPSPAQITTLLPFDGGVLSAAAGQVRVNNAKLEQIRSFSTEDAFARSVALRGTGILVEKMKNELLFEFLFCRNELF